MVRRSTSLPSTLTPTLSLILIPVFMRGNEIIFYLRNINIIFLFPSHIFPPLMDPIISLLFKWNYTDLNRITEIYSFFSL
jgi:hypothetical protein